MWGEGGNDVDQAEIPKLNLLQCIKPNRNATQYGKPQTCKCMWLNMFTVAKLINYLKPTGYVMHHQFNIQQLYALPTLYLCVLYLSENQTAICATYSIN